MIELIIGDYDDTRKYLNKKITSFQEMGIHIQTLEKEDFANKDFEFLIPLGKNLFGESEVFMLKNTLPELNINSFLDTYQKSENHIFFIEEKVLKKERDLFEKKGIPIKDFPPKKIDKNNFNIFKLADSFGKRDKKQLWLDYRDALKYASPEEIHGVLFWQLKNIALVKWDAGNGLKPFVLKKNILYAKNFLDDEIQNISFRFIKIFHERKSISTLSIELEKIILEL